MVATTRKRRSAERPAHTRMSERNWEQFLVERSTDGIVVVGAGDRILEFNPAAEQIFGAQAEAVLGSSVGRFVPERFRQGHSDLIASFLDGAGPAREMLAREPVPALRASGEEFFADIALIPLTIDNEPAVACIVRDVTQRLKNEAAHLQSERLESVRLLSAGLAHDFNNILTAIMGNAEFVLREVGEDSAATVALHDIQQAGRRAAEMVQQMLRFAGKADSERQAVDSGSVVIEMCRLLRPSVGPNVTLYTDIEPGVAAVSADPTSIRQIIMNLVVNAAEAIGQNRGQVVVSMRGVRADAKRLKEFHGFTRPTPGEYVELQVSDNGPGMDRATRARSFRQSSPGEVSVSPRCWAS